MSTPHHNPTKKILGMAFALLSLLPYTMAQPRPVKVDPAIKALMNEADACVKAKGDNCLDLFRDMLAAYHKMPPGDYEDYLHYKLGRAYYFYGMQDSALVSYQRAGSIAEAQKDEPMLADILNAQGTAHYMQGKTEEAITYFIASAQSLERQGDSAHAAYTYVNIGLTLGELESNDESLKYLLRAFKILDAFGETQYMPVVAANIGISYYHLGDLSKATDWARRALGMPDDTVEKSAYPIAYYTLALTHREQPDKALDYARQAVRIADQNSLRSYLYADALVVYAELLSEQGQHSEALRRAELAITIYIEQSTPVGLNRAYRTAAQAAGALGSHARAAQYWGQYAVINDSLQAVANRQIVNELSLQFETEKKDRELAERQLLIARQSARINTIKTIALGVLALLAALWFFYHQTQKLRLAALRQSKELEVLNALMLGEEKERNRMSKELHDGAASLISAALLHLRAAPRTDEDIQLAKVEGILEKTHAEIRRIAHNLMPLTLDQRGLVAAVEEFCALAHGFGVLAVEFEHSTQAPLALGKPSQLVIFRIIQELVQNALKHSGASRVQVRIAQQGATLKVQVADNGQGLAAEGMVEQQGIASIRDRMHTLGGQVDITSEAAQGLRAELSVAHAF